MVEKAQTNINSNSVISLTLGILSILIPFFGIVLGIFGVLFSRKASKQILRTYEGGQGLAISGLVISIVGIIIQTLIIVSYIPYSYTTTVG